MDFSFSWFDIVIVVIILLIGMKGMIDGFIKEIFGLFGIVGGIYFASRFARQAGIFVSENIYDVKNEAAVQLVGFVSLLLTIWLLSILIGIAISKIVDMSGYSVVNKLLGFIFGSVKIFLILSIFVFAISSIGFVKATITTALGESFMYKALHSIGEKIVNVQKPEILDLLDTQNVIDYSANITDEFIDTLNNVTVSNETDILQ